MKYVVGDLILIKDIKLHPRALHRVGDLRHRRYARLQYRLNNTHGIITETINHNDAWQGQSKESDNVYIWFSQVDGKEYYFCEDELTEYEIVK